MQEDEKKASSKIKNCLNPAGSVFFFSDRFLRETNILAPMTSF